LLIQGEDKLKKIIDITDFVINELGEGGFFLAHFKRENGIKYNQPLNKEQSEIFKKTLINAQIAVKSEKQTKQNVHSLEPNPEKSTTTKQESTQADNEFYTLMENRYSNDYNFSLSLSMEQFSNLDKEDWESEYPELKRPTIEDIQEQKRIRDERDIWIRPTIDGIGLLQKKLKRIEPNFEITGLSSSQIQEF